MWADTAKHVGEPKFLFPASVKTWPLSFRSFVHRTTSQGGEGVSVSLPSSNSWLLTDTLRLWPPRKAGEDGRGDRGEGEYMRDWNLRSKGRKDGVGLLRPGRLASEGSTLLPGDETAEPWHRVSFCKGRGGQLRPTCTDGVSSGIESKESIGLPARRGTAAVDPFSDAVSASFSPAISR